MEGVSVAVRTIRVRAGGAGEERESGRSLEDLGGRVTFSLADVLVLKSVNYQCKKHCFSFLFHHSI